MPKVKLEIVPWLTVAWEETAKGRLVVEEKVVPGETLGSLLARLAERHPRFGEYVFDIKRGRLAGFASIVINDDALGQAPDLGRELREGDTIVFLPPYVGGAGLGDHWSRHRTSGIIGVNSHRFPGE